MSFVRVNGKTYTIGRARALGLIPGDATEPTPEPEQLALPLGPARKRIGRPFGSKNRRPKTSDLVLDIVVDPTEAGDVPQVSPLRTVEPLRPKNVDATGTPISDPETLDKIAEKTAAIEIARKGQ